MNSKLIYIIFFILYISFSFSQNIFKTKFEDCNTDSFGIESDSFDTKTDIVEFIKLIKSCYKAENIKNLKGTISLQVLVDFDGKSCLISYEQGTNFKFSNHILKKKIDQNLIWEKPKKKVSPLYIFKFNKNSTQYIRLGLNADKGEHVLEKGEIPN